MSTHRVIYEGSPTFAYALVQCLEEEGVSVSWNPPMEQRGAGDVLAAVAIGLVVNGASDAIKAGVKKFREKFGAKGEIEIDGERE